MMIRSVKWHEQTSLTLCLLAAAGFLVLQALVLLAMGLPLICTCGSIELWHGSASGPETSQHLADWYTYTHVLHGIGFYFFLRLIVPRMPLALRFALAVGLEAAWEVFENTPFVMERYRQSALARGYFGDSVINSVFDTLAAALGFVLAGVLPVWSILALRHGDRVVPRHHDPRQPHPQYPSTHLSERSHLSLADGTVTSA
jgi:hypothetical protein